MHEDQMKNNVIYSAKFLLRNIFNKITKQIKFTIEYFSQGGFAHLSDFKQFELYYPI